ncbi:site-specific integrase [Pectinatus sottacetonis]|uniref:site-specific integrase n=1 Tax=Pectinatus sottacetonis TaxID=1002795 RepID=UPI0018C74765|nr:site-specific integrase [Pectinatus sottacetonis]
MSATKDEKRGTWMMYIRYRDWQGNIKEKRKRGFRTKHEALDYEREFLSDKSNDINMDFSSFVNVYLNNLKPRIKYNTYLTKEAIIKSRILPYFKNLNIDDIAPMNIIKWQNELLSKRDLEGKGYSATYLRTINNQLSAIFNHACRYYNMKENPCAKVEKMGKGKANEMLFWTKCEYLKFSEAMKSKPISYYAFEILYWCGMRLGEMLALTRKDIDLDVKQITINKSVQRFSGQDCITTTKTDKSNRVIDIPDFLCCEMDDYISTIYKCEADTRLFEVTKSYLHHEMDRGVKEAGIKRIRIHDLRHRFL